MSAAAPVPPPTFVAATKAPTQVLGRRTIAIIIDTIVLSAVFVAVAAVFGDLETDGGFRAATGTGGTLLALAIGFLYFTLLEGGPGQTLGKLVTGVRVRRLDGTRVGYGPAAIRTLLRLIDGILFYLVGWIAAMASGPRRQRLGDMLAGTAVSRRS